jgi:dCMP deaminase
LKEKFIHAHMRAAEVYANLSTARRLNVGAIIVKDDRIISIGYNGMPSGWTNDCEEEVRNADGSISLVTKKEVLHAESNAVAKLAKNGESANGATMFVTHVPCVDCAKLIYQSGISSVYYRNSYRSDDGMKFLEKCGIEIKRV